LSTNVIVRLLKMEVLIDDAVAEEHVGSMYFIKMFCRNGCNCYCKFCRKVVSVKCICNRNWHIAAFLFITTYLFEHFNAVNFTSVLNGDGRLITYMTFSKVEINLQL
jgi:hypothetical protein